MTLYRKIAGTWEAIDKATIKVAGAWKDAVVWHKVSGVWKQITSLLAATLNSDSYFALDIGPATCAFRVDNDGKVHVNEGAGYTSRYTWQGGGSASDYQVRWTNISGTLSAGTTGTWQGLGTDRTFSVARNAAPGSKACTGTVEIRNASTLAVLATATISLEAQWM